MGRICFVTAVMDADCEFPSVSVPVFVHDNDEDDADDDPMVIRWHSPTSSVTRYAIPFEYVTVVTGGLLAEPESPLVSIVDWATASTKTEDADESEHVPPE